MSMFNVFPKESVTLIKRNGERFENVQALVQSKLILTENPNLPIEDGDAFERRTPSGVVERYEVIDAGFFPAMAGLPAHYQSKVRKSTAPRLAAIQPSNVVYNATGTKSARQEMPLTSVDILKSDRASVVADLDTLRRLHSRFTAYVELLRELDNGTGSVEAVNAAQKELLLRLRAEEHRFDEWDEGEQMLNPDVFGLAESPNEYLRNGSLAPVAQGADAKFEFLIEQTQDRLRALDAEIAMLSDSGQAVFGEGQHYDAFRGIQQALKEAKTSIRIVDGYIDETVLDLLKNKPAGVTVEILTKPKGVRQRPSLASAAKAFNQQYGGLEIRTSDAFHDRFIVVDDARFYHLGASIKDAGQSGFMFSRIGEPAAQEMVRKLWNEAWGAATKI